MIEKKITLDNIEINTRYSLNGDFIIDRNIVGSRK